MDANDTEEEQASFRARSLGMTPGSSLWHRIREPESWTPGERQTVLDDLFYEGAAWIPFLKRFFALMALSTAIAAFGLISDSAAVVIGAMLVAPLMTPMLATAAAIVYGRLDRIVVSIIVIASGTAVAILVGVAVAWITPGVLTATDLSGQILSRTNPSLLDLGIAIAAGLAAGYVLGHKRIGSSLPGAAIAVALVPPLATVGITLKLGATAEAEGAMLLYLTNMVAIILAAGVALLASGFVPHHVREVARGHLRIGFFISAIALLVIAVPLGLHTVDAFEREQLKRLVVRTIPEWDDAASVQLVTVQRGGDRAEVDVLVASTRLAQPAWRLAELLADSSGVEMDLTVRYVSQEIDAASTR